MKLQKMQKALRSPLQSPDASESEWKATLSSPLNNAILGLCCCPHSFPAKTYLGSKSQSLRTIALSYVLSVHSNWEVSGPKGKQ